jgi:branched-chain amino acid transport system ATP-binding protein
MSALLDVSGVSKSFRGLKALSGLTMSVGEGEIIGLVGPNGAGTAFNVISGALPATAGTITLLGRTLNGLQPHEIVRRGLARTFQATNVFKEASVLENVMRGLLVSFPPRLWASMFNTPGNREQAAGIHKRALEIIELVGLSQVAGLPADSLPYGHQRSLGVAIALASKPRVLLLDEPAAGLNPAEAQHMGALIQRIHSQLNISVLLVEHNMRMVMGICDRIVVLKHGEMIAQGTPTQIRNDPHVISAYLGSDDTEEEAHETTAG